MSEAPLPEPSELVGQRWFGGKGRGIERTVLVDELAVGPGGSLALVDVMLAGGELQRYAMPRWHEPGDRLFGPLLARLGEGLQRGGGGSFELRPPMRFDTASSSERPVGSDQSNTSIVLDRRWLVKCYRRLWPGTHPEVELVTFLTGRFAGVPAALGSLHYVADSGEEYALALVQEYVPDAEDGWAWCQRLVEEAGRGAAIDAGWAGELGALVARLHEALAGLATQIAAQDWLARRRGQAEAELAEVVGLIGGETAGRAAEELARFDRPEAPQVLTRVHGDLHVGQILRSPGGYHVIDFEGEPTRPLEERRATDSPLRDVASMLRSIDHVPLWVFRERPEHHELGRAWSDACRGAFLGGYGGALDHSVLRALEVEKAVYEFVYADSFLPEWLPIARAGIAWLLGRPVRA